MNVPYKVVQAFKALGVPEAAALDAAEALVENHTEPLEDIKTKLGGLDTRLANVESRLINVEQTLNLHSWLLGIVAVAAVGQFVQGLFP